jgi:sugar lactone lactonase YvrE
MQPVDLDIEREPVSALFIAQLNALGEVQGEPRMVEIQGSRHVTALSFRKGVPRSYLCTTHSGLAYLSEETGKVEHLPGSLGEIIPKDKQSYMRFNDGYSDTKGRFYFHSMSRDDSKKDGQLFMYQKGMKSEDDLKVLADNFAIGNGPVIDEERKKCYFNVTSECISCSFPCHFLLGR